MDTAETAGPGEGPSNVRRNRGLNVRRRRRRRGGARDHHNIPGHHASRETRVLISTPPLMHFMKYVPPFLLSLVVLKYQGKPESLFRGNPATVGCSIAATSVYWVIVAEMKRIPGLGGIRLWIYWGAALASGILSAFSLLSIFFSYPVSLGHTIWLPVPLVLAWPRVDSLFRRGIRFVKGKIDAARVWARGLINSTGRASLPT